MRSNGIESIIDQWSLGPGDDLPLFMEKNLESADRVLMICTDNYVAKANSGAGGVGYEKMIVTSDILRKIDSNKVIPLIRQSGTSNVPTFLRTKLYIDLSRDDQFESGFDDLIRSIHGKPLYEAPPVSNNPFTSVEKTVVQRTGDGVLEVMKIIVNDFESTSSPMIYYDSIFRKSNMSRIMLDIYINQAVEQGLIKLHNGGSILTIATKGKIYAMDHKLIEI